MSGIPRTASAPSTESVLDQKPSGEATATVIKKVGRIDDELAGNGHTVGIGDTVIATIRLVHEEPVLTRNIDHFDQLHSLDLEYY